METVRGAVRRLLKISICAFECDYIIIIIIIIITITIIIIIILLLKIGSQAPQIYNPVTYREAKTLLHSRYNGDWKKQNGGYQAHLDPIWRLERAQQTTIFRLRTGHCGLSAHLKRTGISDTSLCECGQADQTADHVLQSCPNIPSDVS